MHRFLFHRFKGTLFVPLWLLVYLLIGQGALQNFVLCFGVDGHITVESAPAGMRCGTPPNAGQKGILSSPQAQKRISTYGHCGPCQDVSISVDRPYPPVYSIQDSLPQIESLVLAVSLSSPSPHVEALPETLLPRRSPPGNSSLASLRSVVLLM